MSDAAQARTTSARALLARDLVECLGGRYSSELGIDVDQGANEIERWALAATLFGARISTDIAEHSFAVLSSAGVRNLADAGTRSTAQLVALLDEGGYARYDYRTADRLQRLAAVLGSRYGGRISSLIARQSELRELEAELDALPGWGPVTVALFLREVRGSRPWLEPSLDPRALEAAEHLGLIEEDLSDAAALDAVKWLARDGDIEIRDLEGALVRASLAHGRHFVACAGGADCEVLRRVRSGAARPSEPS